MRSDGDADLEAMSDDLRADIVRITPRKVSDMCVGAFKLAFPLYQ